MIRLLSLLLFAPIVEANTTHDTLVFKDASHMEVVSYEIRGNLLVITTVDGELRSFPKSLVDLEATASANRNVSPGEDLPKVRLDKSRRVLELYGTPEILELLCAQFQQLAQAELAEDAPAHYHQPFLEASQRTFAVAPMLRATLAQLADNASESELDAWIVELERDPLQRIMELEKKSSSFEGIEFKKRYRDTIKVSPPSEDLLRAVARIDANGAGAELGADAYLTMFRTWEDVARKVFPKAETHDLDAFRVHLVEKGRRDNTGSLATYHTADLDDLREYAVFLESPEGQRFSAAFKAAFSAGLEAAHRDTVRAWLEAAALL